MRSRAPPPPQPTFRAYAIAGKIFHPPHPHTHTHHLIDFINPDCRLLGKNVHALVLRPKKRTFGEGRPSQAGWVQVGPWKAGGGYQRLTYGERSGNVRVTFG